MNASKNTSLRPSIDSITWLSECMKTPIPENLGGSNEITKYLYLHRPLALLPRWTKRHKGGTTKGKDRGCSSSSLKGADHGFLSHLGCSGRNQEFDYGPGIGKNWLALRPILPAWFDHPQGNKVFVKKFSSKSCIHLWKPIAFFQKTRTKPLRNTTILAVKES